MWNDLELLENKKRLISTISISIILLLTFIDVISDYSEGVNWRHLLIEFLIIFACLCVLLTLWWRTISLSTQRHDVLKHELSKTHADLIEWRNKTHELLDGLGKAIQEQFDNWGLSAAEQEVGLLLLKGLSIKEIANIRETSERTVRHQATSIYRKGNLQGRGELSAFFLEDLLLPQSIKMVE